MECVAPRETLLERLTQRESETTTSDGRLEILEQQLALREPVSEFAPKNHITVDTANDIETIMEAIWAQL